ncbi:hypothetical protein ABAC460_02325 [Asticcacaulis sp. AC460]|uniref:hypothetical protein n=1 Tax=Asticcacaulis sp. AC460 TaxID=1282360 RepID=UPI0003C3DFC3|nr:hypothetical protein [Asticcacaulis sp. AC460]ESQ93115.1 hypothetical protein ABAC460_02325 [Asticcacaulis sp. AC460]
MIKSVIFAGVASVCALAAGSALADCDAKQESDVAKAVAEAAREYVPQDGGEQYVDLPLCEGGGSRFDARFRYGVERDGKNTWVEGRAIGRYDRVDRLIIKRASDDMQAQDHARADD